MTRCRHGHQRRIVMDENETSVEKNAYATDEDFRNIIDNISFTYIAPSTIHGMGLFARCQIKKGTILGTLDGQVMSWEQYGAIMEDIRQHITKDDVPNLFFEWNAIENETLLVRPFRTKYSFINHSRTPNVILQRFPLRVVALTDINANEELLLDYRMEPLNNEYLTGHGRTYL